MHLFLKSWVLDIPDPNWIRLGIPNPIKKLQVQKSIEVVFLDLPIFFFVRLGLPKVSKKR